MDPRLNLIITAQDKASRVIDGTSKSAGGLRSELGKLKVPALAAAGAIGALAVSSVNAASDLEESINAVNVVFQGASDTVLDFGEQAAQSVGLSNAAFNELATETGAILLNFGLGHAEAAEQTVILAERAADLASVFNTDVSVAMDAINQAIRGETEAIRRFGGDVTDATLQMSLLSQGIDVQVSSLSQAEKGQLRLAELMSQTDIVAGDFNETSDSLANTTRILASEWEDMQAQIGEFLIPALTDTAVAINDVISGERNIIEQSLETGLLGWIARIGDETRFRTVPIIQEEFIPAVDMASDSDLRWADTIRQLSELKAKQSIETAKLAEETMKLTEETLAHNEAARKDGEAIAGVTEATYSWEEAMGVAEISARAVNDALRAQKQRADDARIAFIEYQAAVSRTLEGRRGQREATEFLENAPQATGRARTGRALATHGTFGSPVAIAPQPVTLQIGTDSIDGVVFQGAAEYAQVNGL